MLTFGAIAADRIPLACRDVAKSSSGQVMAVILLLAYKQVCFHHPVYPGGTTDKMKQELQLDAHLQCIAPI